MGNRLKHVFDGVLKEIYVNPRSKQVRRMPQEEKHSETPEYNRVVTKKRESESVEDFELLQLYPQTFPVILTASFTYRSMELSGNSSAG